MSDKEVRKEPPDIEIPQAMPKPDITGYLSSMTLAGRMLDRNLIGRREFVSSFRGTDALSLFSEAKSQSRSEQHDALTVMLFCGGSLPPFLLSYGKNRTRIRCLATTIRYWLLSYDSRVLVYDAGLLPYDTRVLVYDSHFIVYQ